MAREWTQDFPFFQNEILFGHDPTPGVVAAELEAGDKIRLYFREGDTVSSRTDSFRPFMLLAGEDSLAGWDGDVATETLSGDGAFNRLAVFPSVDALDKARDYLQKKSGKGPTAVEAPYLYWADPVHQYLLASGKTHFLDLPFKELKRLQLDIETYCAAGFEFPNAARDSDRITAIALSDSTGWERLISGREHDEPAMLREMVEEIRRRDPDVIEGHNLFRFDLEYIEARARKHGIALTLGRNDSALKGRPSRTQIAERTITYRKYEIFGRHIVDTWILAQHYDVATRDLESYGLKEVARHFGVADAERTYIPGDQVSWYFDHDPDALFRYALDDVRETRAVAEILSASYFVEAQIFPHRYQDVPLRGNATKINSLFVREYLRRRRSVPRPDGVQEVGGGYTAIERQGLAKRVLHCDVTSLYPSIMLEYGYFPKKDVLGVFPGLLRDLRDFRLKAKALARDAQSEGAKLYLTALQSTFKILINSFYGYLGFALGYFNDYEAANRVTAKGRELIQVAIAALKERGAAIIEVDTDGIYFVPPEAARTRSDEERLIEEVAATLPRGIVLELDGRYPAMFSYKVKNYALLDEKGRLLIKGSGLRSRGFELFLRQWLEEMLRLLMTGQKEKIAPLYERYLDDLENHRMDISLLMKTETLQESLESYQAKVKAKKRNPAAAYEIALQDSRAYQPGDQISFYVTGRGAKLKINENCKLAAQWDSDRPDENVEYYKAKLKELYDKFRPLIEEA
jgi:DNA polymerase elongation subunit (family B)